MRKQIFLIKITDKIMKRVSLIGLIVFATLISCGRDSKKTDSNDSVSHEIEDTVASNSNIALAADTVPEMENGQISNEDLELLKGTIDKIYKKGGEYFDGTFDDWTMKRIKKYGTPSLIRATEQNYYYAKKHLTEEQPSVDPNPLIADFYDVGTDGMYELRYKGFSLGEVNKKGETVDAEISLKLDEYEKGDGVNWRLYAHYKYQLNLRFVFSNKDGKRICKLDDIMIVSKPKYVDIPRGKWLKKEMENNRLLKPAFRP